MDTIYQSYIKEAEKLEKTAKRLRETAKRWKYGYDNIHMGTIILDLETELIMKVDKLKNGSNDFEAHPVNNSKDVGRGYYYTVSNWEIVCNHKYTDGRSAIKYNSSYEMRSNDMYCKLCGKNGTKKELEKEQY